LLSAINWHCLVSNSSLLSWKECYNFCFHSSLIVLFFYCFLFLLVLKSALPDLYQTYTRAKEYLITDFPLFKQVYSKHMFHVKYLSSNFLSFRFFFFSLMYISNTHNPKGGPYFDVIAVSLTIYVKVHNVSAKIAKLWPL
jgi:hypothetical protein